jgi:microsomal dipeptidase-like Zn-dependent dipeptidase
VVKNTHPLSLVLSLLLACNGDKADTPNATDDTGTALYMADLDVYGQAGGCYTLHSSTGWLAPTDSGYAFDEDAASAARFRLQPSDLATYLFYDQDGYYLTAEDGPLLRQAVLESDISRIEDGYISGAEWILEPAEAGGERYQLRSRRTDQTLTGSGLTTGVGTALVLEASEGCATHPELSVDASGTVTKTTFDDGDLYGIADTHSHILSNLGFGGGIFHGGAYHQLGVEHALPDCEAYHGEAGRKDFFGYAFDEAGNDASSLTNVVFDLLAGQLREDNHATDGYPTFSEWPDARSRSTHQVQYYRWLERAHLSGLRLVVQHATSNSVICNLSVGEGLQPGRYDCEDMTAVDRILDGTRDLERYIDAVSGGPGLGWFRIVESPAEAREVIAAGKMAVILGIETSDLFNCHLTPRPGAVACDEAYVLDQLDDYYDRGVRALFPVHKYDNQFTPGDGSDAFIELGNFLNSGHWTNKTQDCPGGDMPTGFDGGGITFGGLQDPRDEFLSKPPNDLSGFSDAPLTTALGFADKILEPSLDGEWCQNATITPLGEVLIEGMIDRGMIIEVDHFPQWSYQRVYEMLEENDYPAAGTHGRNWGGRLYALGGVSKINLGRCRDSEAPGAMLSGLLDEVDLITTSGGYPAAGLGLDLNGFAGAPRPRFGEDGCSSPQEDPTTYPFQSYAGDVEFTQPQLGDRSVDFDTEGLVHIGLLPELIEDARRDAVSESDLEPLFRSAEAYIRMWELAESRSGR